MTLYMTNHFRHVDAELLPFHTPYTGKFISHLPDGGIIFQDFCQYQGYAVHVKCPTVPCGNRIVPKAFSPRYQSKRETPKGNSLKIYAVSVAQFCYKILQYNPILIYLS